MSSQKTDREEVAVAIDRIQSVYSVVSDMDRVQAFYEKALGLPSVRGLIVGRTLLYPADDDVSSAVATAVSMVR